MKSAARNLPVLRRRPYLHYLVDVSASAVESYPLYAALVKIGIDEKTRKARGLDFHAWRHTFNSLLIDRRVSLQAVQSVTGHLTDEMTQRYYHLGGESGAGIRQIAESLFVEEKKPTGTGRKDKKEETARKAPGR